MLIYLADDYSQHSGELKGVVWDYGEYKGPWFDSLEEAINMAYSLPDATAVLRQPGSSKYDIRVGNVLEKDPAYPVDNQPSVWLLNPKEWIDRHTEYPSKILRPVNFIKFNMKTECHACFSHVPPGLAQEPLNTIELPIGNKIWCAENNYRNKILREYNFFRQDLIVFGLSQIVKGGLRGDTTGFHQISIPGTGRADRRENSVIVIKPDIVEKYNTKEIFKPMNPSDHKIGYDYMSRIQKLFETSKGGYQIMLDLSPEIKRDVANHVTGLQQLILTYFLKNPPQIEQYEWIKIDKRPIGETTEEWNISLITGETFKFITKNSLTSYFDDKANLNYRFKSLQ